MNYVAITKDEILQGEGLRVALWVSGCSIQCKGCHNHHYFDKNCGKLFDIDAWCDIEDQLDKDYIQGLTILGGNPTDDYNIDEVTAICKQVRNLYPHKDIWLYSGHSYSQIKDLEVMNYIDVLCEGPFIEELKDENTPWVGSTNQRVIDMKKTLEKGEIVLWQTL